MGSADTDAREPVREMMREDARAVLQIRELVLENLQLRARAEAAEILLAGAHETFGKTYRRAVDFEARNAMLQGQLTIARETTARLNRRCQLAAAWKRLAKRERVFGKDRDLDAAYWHKEFVAASSGSRCEALEADFNARVQPIDPAILDALVSAEQATQIDKSVKLHFDRAVQKTAEMAARLDAAARERGKP